MHLLSKSIIHKEISDLIESSCHPVWSDDGEKPMLCPIHVRDYDNLDLRVWSLSSQVAVTTLVIAALPSHPQCKSGCLFNYLPFIIDCQMSNTMQLFLLPYMTLSFTSTQKQANK